jgi:uracil phosphoribosyltransferase
MGAAFGPYARYWYVETESTRTVAGLWHFTGGSALMAVDVLLSRGVPEERILFLNLIASPEGAAVFAKRFPKLRVVTAFVDEGLDEKK